MTSKRFILGIFTTVLTYTVLHIGLFHYQLGAKVTRRGHFETDIYAIREKRAKSIEGRKIIIASGSNSLFGVNSETLSKVLRLPVVNLGLSAAYDIDYYYQMIARNIGHYDVVVLPLEHRFYPRDYYNKHFMDLYIQLPDRSYYNHLSLAQKLTFMTLVSPARVLAGVHAKSKGKAIRQTHNLHKKQEKALKKNAKTTSLGYRLLNKNGDRLHDEVSRIETNKDYFDENMKVSSHFLKTFKKIAELVKENEGMLIVVPPVTFTNPKYDLNTIKDQERTQQFYQTVERALSMKVHCNPALSHFEQKFGFNTPYHANKQGALIRSENLAHCLKRVLAGDGTVLSYNDALAKTKQLEEKYAPQLKKAYFEQRLKDLTVIKNALESYHQDHGFYPESNLDDNSDYVFNRFISKKKNAKSWIAGLVPKYLPKLPVDPRKDKDTRAQYLYKSNGYEYKLIANKVEDCHIVKRRTPEYIDPRRVCGYNAAYGFWTSGGKNW